MIQIQQPVLQVVWPAFISDMKISLNDALICKYYGALQQSVSDGLAKNEEHDWLTEDERIEFRELLNVFRRDFGR